MDKIIVTIIGLGLAIFVYWFFLMRKSNVVEANGEVTIVVAGGYTPEVVTIPVGRKTVINFVRQDRSSCLEEVVLGDFGIRRSLPLNQKVSFEIQPEKPGEYTYSCGMNMFHGKIIVT